MPGDTLFPPYRLLPLDFSPLSPHKHGCARSAGGTRKPKTLLMVIVGKFMGPS